MSGRIASFLGPGWLGAIAVIGSIALVAACSGGGGPTVQPEPTLGEYYGYPADTPYNGPAPGTWTGTITFTGSIGYDKEEPGHSDLDPSNTYYEEWVTTEAVHEDATDTFTISAADDEDLTYGIRSVELAGDAANSGNTQQRSVKLTDKGNSGCTWKQEDGSETTGSWSNSGDVQGDLHFGEDGSYELNVSAYSSGFAEVPAHDWLKYNGISADCEVNFPPYDTPRTGGPLVEWVSSHQNDQTVGNVSTLLEGQSDASNPGTTVDGTKTWELLYPEGYKITVTWHLVHSTPIVLPHS